MTNQATTTEPTLEPPDRISINPAEAARYPIEDRRIGDIEYTRVSVPSIAPVVDDNDINAGVWFQSAVSGMWYRERGGAGDLSAVRIDGVRFVPSPNALCVCGHIRKVHESFEDHDECMGCIKERDGLTEEHCSWFQAAPASPAALRDEAELPPSVKTSINGIARHIAAPIRECATAEQYAEVIRRATDLQTATAETLTRATASPATAAAKIADQLIPHLDHAFLLTKGWRDQIASIIERCLST